MSIKKRKSRTVGFLNNQPAAKLPSPDEVNKTIAKVTGKETETAKTEEKTATTQSKPRYIKTKPAPKPKPQPVVPTQKRVPLTTAITPENRAKLEVASIHSNASVADMLNEALEHYFEHIVQIQDKSLIETFTTIYARKAK